MFLVSCIFCFLIDKSRDDGVILIAEGGNVTSHLRTLLLIWVFSANLEGGLICGFLEEGFWIIELGTLGRQHKVKTDNMGEGCNYLSNFMGSVHINCAKIEICITKHRVGVEKKLFWISLKGSKRLGELHKECVEPTMWRFSILFSFTHYTWREDEPVFLSAPFTPWQHLGDKN